MNFESLKELAQVDPGLVEMWEEEGNIWFNVSNDIDPISWKPQGEWSTYSPIVEFGRELYWLLLDRIRVVKGWHWEVKSIPNIRAERYTAIIKCRPPNREKWDCNSADGSTPVDALVKAYIRACKSQ